MRRRLDAELVRRGLVTGLEAARAAVASGRVLVAGAPAGNPSSMVAADASLAVGEPADTFVSRGGHKLAAALDRFGVDPTGLNTLDAGASTGGFTDCLLQRGAARVIAIDVGYGDFAWSLRTDARVHVLERTNLRDLTPGDLPFRPALVVADLSFMSLAGILTNLVDLAAEDASFVVLVKPQFEAPRGGVETKGVVRDPATWKAAIERVAVGFADIGVSPVGVMASPLRGKAGNVEFFLYAAPGPLATTFDLGHAIEEGRNVAEGEDR
ncbi:MAG: TlyA family RNA methyltransferase [Actinomycetota bacterium]